MKEITGKIMKFGVPTQVGTFGLFTDKDGLVFLTYPCSRGALFTPDESEFHSDDGRVAKIFFVKVQNEIAKYCVQEELKPRS